MLRPSVYSTSRYCGGLGREAGESTIQERRCQVTKLKRIASGGKCADYRAGTFGASYEIIREGNVIATVRTDTNKGWSGTNFTYHVKWLIEPPVFTGVLSEDAKPGEIYREGTVYHSFASLKAMVARINR